MGISALASHKTKNQPHKLKETNLECNSSLYFTQKYPNESTSSQSFCSEATNKSKSSAPSKQSSSSTQAKESTVIPSYTDKAIVKDAEICVGQ